jgi:hypothetical protein
MKFRCTLSFDVDMPCEKRNVDAEVSFAGFVTALLMENTPNYRVMDFKLVSAKAKKIKGGSHDRD